MRKQLLALAIVGALACPQVAFAARDGDGMEYTSAAEGFYGSLRMMFSNQHNKKGDADQNGILTGDGSRLGVRGTLDLGHGLTGVYRYEFSVAPNNGDALGDTRLHYVGLKGAFGEVQAGALWDNNYNWVTSATDIATTGSGNFAPNFRRNNSLQYTSPDLNGFQGSFRFALNGGTEDRNLGILDTNADTDGNQSGEETGENVDEWNLAAKYGVRGFTVAGVYEVHPGAANKKPALGTDGAGVVSKVRNAGTALEATEDVTFWALRGGYGQDNWAVNAWYGVRNDSDWTNGEDMNIFSVAGNISIGKVALIVIHENREKNKAGVGEAGGSDVGGTTQTRIAQVDDTATILNVEYNFTSKSRVYAAYIARDYDGRTAGENANDEVRIGLRMDF